VPTFYLGVDIAKQTFVAALAHEGAEQRLGEFPNTEAGFHQWVAAFQQATQTADDDLVHVVLEPTAGYELPLALFAYQRGWQVSLPNPKHVRDYANSLGRRAKTDRQDALLLARYGAERKPVLWAPLPTEISELDSLLTRQRQLEEMLGQERRRQEAFTGRPGVAASLPGNLKTVIESLEAALNGVKKAIQSHLKKHRHLKEQAKRLQTVPGVGAKSVLPLLVLLSRWHALTGGKGAAKGLVAFAGLDPTTHESGTSVRGSRRISRKGNRRIGPHLYMSALGGVKGNNALRAFYQGLVQRGKRKKVALVAAARKILVWAWAVFRDHTEFQASLAQAEPVATA
jgi:transposase